MIFIIYDRIKASAIIKLDRRALSEENDLDIPVKSWRRAALAVAVLFFFSGSPFSAIICACEANACACKGTLRLRICQFDEFDFHVVSPSLCSRVCVAALC